jgi:hypothetical protein
MLVRFSLWFTLAFFIGNSVTGKSFGETLASNAIPSARTIVASIETGRSVRMDRATPVEPNALSDQEVQRIGQQAYVWGWPLVYVHNCRQALNKVTAPGRSGGMPVAPANQLCMLTDYISPSVSVVPCPNQDVIYGFGALDLADEPVVLQVPNFGDRFWIFQLGDQRTDSFAQVGKMYGTKPGHYLIVGPDWNGTRPEGIVDVFRSPTRIGYVLPRVFIDDTAADRESVQPVINQIVMYPLSRHRGEWKTYDWSSTRWLPRLASSSRGRGRWVVPEKFFDVLPEVLENVAPLPGEESFYAEIRRVLALAERDERVRNQLIEIAIAAEAQVMSPLFEFRNFGESLPHYWSTISNGGAFGTDYLTRSAVARSNVFVNRAQETKYFYQDFDAQGERLDGSKQYQVTFAAGRLPPAKGFWSLTLYNDQHNFHPNELGRYSLGTKSRQMRFNPDGSLTIYVQREPPREELRQNWLPAPDGQFSLYLRAYWPEVSVIDGSWTPPAVAMVRNLAEVSE